jgi:hypothetical protein
VVVAFAGRDCGGVVKRTSGISPAKVTRTGFLTPSGDTAALDCDSAALICDSAAPIFDSAAPICDSATPICDPLRVEDRLA